MLDPISAASRAVLDDEILQGRGVGVGGLLEEPIEQRAAAGGCAAVEAEGEFVRVVGQLLPRRWSRWSVTSWPNGSRS